MVLLKNISQNGLMVLGLSLALTGCQAESGPLGWSSFSASNTYQSTADRPSLIRSNAPPPRVVYSRGSRDHVLKSNVSSDYSHLKRSNISVTPRKRPSVETLVSRKINDLASDLFHLQKNIRGYASQLRKLEVENEVEANIYYASIASISSQLQSGSTPGNPLLIQRWNNAQTNLNTLAQSSGLLNDLSTDISNEASKSAYLLESARSTFNLSGAVEKDHTNLVALEDDINQTIVRIDRLLNTVNDEMTRRNTYLRSERLNMQALSLSIANGELYGQSLSNQLFKRATSASSVAPSQPPVVNSNGTLIGRRPLVIIRFDRPNVRYQQPIYSAISQVLERFPAAQFDLVAVSPVNGNPAEVALASTAARKNGEDVLRSLSSMGLPLERVNLNAATSNSIHSSEVHLYVQ